MLTKLITYIKYRKACKQINALHDAMLMDIKHAVRIERQTGAVSTYHRARIANHEAQAALIAARFETDCEAMRLAGIEMGY